jgi:hypothetical protein
MRVEIDHAHMMKVHVAPRELKRRSCLFSRQQRSSLSQMLLLVYCVSAPDQMQFFPDAPFSPNMRKQNVQRIAAAIRRASGLLNNSQ